jgi:tRNA-dihydrouridine synthase
MIGRGFFGKPWLLNTKNKPSNIEDKLKIMLEHTKLFEKLLGKRKNFAVMKKHFKAYVSGFDGAKELRVKLMEAENSKQVKNLIGEFLKTIRKVV